jgi:hypothetical protein
VCIFFQFSENRDFSTQNQIVIFLNQPHYDWYKRIKAVLWLEGLDSFFFFQFSVPSKIKAMGWAQPLKQMRTRHLPWGRKARHVREAEKLIAICELIVWKRWDPQRYTILLASRAC